MKQVLITGIGSGIGEATCHQFLKEGYSVIGILRNQNHLSKLKKNFGSFFNNLTPIYADLESSSFVETVWGQLADYKVDYLNCIVNIAGVLDTTQIDNVSVQQIEKVMRVNFVNPTMLISKLKPLLLTANSANIINITSMSGFLGSVRFPGLSIYGASKAALGSLSESLSVEFADHNIHINALAIGAVNTQMLQNAFPDFQATISPSQMGRFIYEFAIHGFKFYNGKVLPVAITNP